MKLNALDRAIAWFDPRRAAERVRARAILAAYEAARPTRTRRNPSDNTAPDLLTLSAEELRGQARVLDQNHDLARGVLNVLVQNVVGPRGIGIEPQPKRADGTIHDAMARQLSELWTDWCKRPEVTHQMSWAKVQRLAARAWLRDGEVFARDHSGTVLNLQHGTEVPYSIELFEADFLPLDKTEPAARITQGVEKDFWGRALAYHFYIEHPGGSYYSRGQTRRVLADFVHHVKMVDRLHQTRGVSVFAAVTSRLNDIKDYEEAERVAARIAAAMAVFIKKGGPESYESDGGTVEEGGVTRRAFGPVVPGMIIDNLQPGEDVGTISSDRPNANLGAFRADMLRAVAAGSGAGYSSISKNYNGTYSAQRQELVEQWDAYAGLADEFIDSFVRPVYERFIAVALAKNIGQFPTDLDRSSIYDADFIPPAMPWIDPLKEADADRSLVDGLLTSPQRVIRRRGINPNDVLDQNERWQRELEKRGLNKPAPEPAPAAATAESAAAAARLEGAVIGALEVVREAGAHRAELQPITVNVAPAAVSVEPAVVNLDLRRERHGTWEREIVEKDAYGVPIRMIEREIVEGAA